MARTRILEPFPELPYAGAIVQWTTDYSNPPLDYKVARLSAAGLYALIEADCPGTPGMYSFWVPIQCVLHVKYLNDTLAQRYAAPKKLSAVADPHGLSECKTPQQFMALGAQIGMDDDAQVDLLTVTKRAPNPGQVVMQGRNAIRRWLQQQLKETT